jgi:hypothetical protein
VTLPGPRAPGPTALAAAATVRCGEDDHRVGVTARGQAVMLDHDRSLERLAVGLEREARTACGRAYDGLRSALAGATECPPELAGPGPEALGDYVVGAQRIRHRRRNAATHTLRLTQISVLGGGPPHLQDWPRRWRTLTRGEGPQARQQAQHRARRSAVERIVPELFLRAGYPIVARHPPAGPGARRGACWHVTVADLSPDDDFAVTTAPHPGGRGRVCHLVTVPLSPEWYRDVYKTGLALLDGRLVVARRWPGREEARDQDVVTVFAQEGARFRLRDAEAERTPHGWRFVRWYPGGPEAPGVPAGGTGTRPSPWD